jgi:hypothetical protein
MTGEDGVGPYSGIDWMHSGRGDASEAISFIVVCSSYHSGFRAGASPGFLRNGTGFNATFFTDCK